MTALCLYSLIGFFIAPWVIGWYAPKFVKEQLQCQLDMGKVRINPFLLTFEVSDVSLSTPEEPLAGFKRLFIDFEITRLLNGVATFRELRLEKPTVHVTVYPDGSINLEKAIPKSPAQNIFRLSTAAHDDSKRSDFRRNDRCHGQTSKPAGKSKHPGTRFERIRRLNTAGSQWNLFDISPNTRGGILSMSGTHRSDAV